MVLTRSRTTVPQTSTTYHLQAKRVLSLPHLVKMASRISEKGILVKMIKRGMQRQVGHRDSAKEILQKKRLEKASWIIRPS